MRRSVRTRTLPSQAEPALVREFLLANSGLPGPRANLALADEFAESGSPEQIREFAHSPDEYLALCGSIGLGELLARGDDTSSELHALASDERWRVREGVARGLQRVPLTTLLLLVEDWSRDPDPLVQRAAIAAICEPRLLKDAAAAATALAACETTTAAFLASGSRSRVLRQALGYCWSVGIAASPGPGLSAFARLRENDDPDAQWIVRENLTKARLKKLL